MPAVPPRPTSHGGSRLLTPHRVAGLIGGVVVVALAVAASFAPAPAAVVRPVAAQAPVVRIGNGSFLAVTAAGGTAEPAPLPPAAVTATLPIDVPTDPGAAITTLAERGIPLVALQAYRQAAALQATERPDCHLSWTLVAAIGAVESGHGTHAGSQLYADGQDLPHVVGPVLDGSAGNARIADTDGGALDGDPVYDRAVGPMQFIPSTWARVGRDGNGDGRVDPFNIYDAAATTGVYLCRAGGDLSTDAGRAAAVFSYNHLDSYVTLVLGIEAAYAGRPPLVVGTAPPTAPTSPVASPSGPPVSAPPATTGPPATTAPPTDAPPVTTAPPTDGTSTPSCPDPTDTTGTPTGTPTDPPTGTPTDPPTGCVSSSAAQSSSGALSSSTAPDSPAAPSSSLAPSQDDASAA